MNPFPLKRKLPVLVLVLFVIAPLLAKDLLFTPIHGMADNRDFWRVMVPAGLLYEARPSDILFKSVQRTFVTTAPRVSLASTSAVIPALVTKTVAAPFSRTYDIRLLGAFYLIVFLSGLYLLLRSAASLLLAAGLAWISLEPAYYLHFNSFFSVSVHLAFWPWLLWGLWETASRARGGGRLLWPLAALAVSALLIGTSKLQFVMVPALCLAVLFFSGTVSRSFSGIAWVLGPVILLALAFSFLYFPKGKQEVLLLSRYQSVFGGIASVAENPPGALRKLAIPAEFHHLAGRNLPEELLRGELPDAFLAQLDGISRWKLFWLYFSESGAMSGVLKKVGGALVKTPLGYLGNFEVGSGRPEQELRHYWQFSRIRDFVLGWAPWLAWVAAFAALLTGLVGVWRQSGPHFLLLAFLSLHFFSQILIVVLGDGVYALQRHFLVARLCLDLMFWLLLAEALGRSAWFAFLRRALARVRGA